MIVDHNPAAFAHIQAAGPGQGILGTDAGGKHNQIGFQMAVVGEVHPQPRVAARNNGRGGFLGVHLHAQILDLLAQKGATLIVQLHRHQARGKFHHMGLQPQAFQGVCRFQPQQTAAHHDTGFR